MRPEFVFFHQICSLEEFFPLQMEYESYRTVKNTLRQAKIAPKSDLKMISVPAKPAFNKTSLVLGLEGMDAADAVEFFEKHGIKGIRAEIETTCEEYDFHPLAIRLLTGTLKKDPRYFADIKYAPQVDINEADKKKRIQKMLDFAYNSLSPEEQKLLSQLAAFRGTIKWETISTIFLKDFKHEGDLVQCVINLTERGLCMRDEENNTFDLHPVIRRYSYNRLNDSKKTHERLIAYFNKIKIPEKIQSVADLQGLIELYHHLVYAELYDLAYLVFHKKIWDVLYYRFGGYQIQIELLEALFQNSENNLPKLKDKRWQGAALNDLANAYQMAGQPERARSLFENYIMISQERKDKLNEAIGLGNIAKTVKIQLGELEEAVCDLEYKIEICLKINDKEREAIGHRDLARAMAYCGKFDSAEEELAISRQYDLKNNRQGLTLDFANYTILLLLMGKNALEASYETREFAERASPPVERDFIYADWLIGAALIASVTNNGEASSLYKAAQHLEEALKRSRRIKLVELEAPILLEFAKLRKAQAMVEQSNHSSISKQEQLMSKSSDFAHDALKIAARCGYRLQLAEIHNFLAEWHLQQFTRETDEKKRKESLEKARQHAEDAKDRAWCDGPPYYYKVAYERAEQMCDYVQDIVHNNNGHDIVQ